MTTLFFVRHGMTAHTGLRLSGWLPDIHLNEAGVSQAEAVAERLARVPLKAVYSSPLERTLETANAIAKRHRLDVKVRKNLGEVEYGKWTNRSFKSLVRTKLWTRVKEWPSGMRFPEGEALRQVQDRALDEVERICADHPRQAVCVVSHADVIRLVAAHYLGMHIDLFQRIVIGPVSVTVIAVDDSGPRVLTLNAPVAGEPRSK